MTRLFSPLALVATALSLFAHSTTAQVTTDCQPLNTTNCPADPAFGTDHMFIFNSTPSSDFWVPTAGSVSYSAENGAQFTINKQGDSPTIRSSFYIFFGRTEMMIKAASGTGIISSVMFLSDDLDEIDLEFMGGNQSYVETNYFGKGRQDFNNAIYYPVNGGISNDFHNYTTVWTNESLTYYIDGTKARTLLPKDANNTSNYPQTPVRISLGIWAGGDPTLPEGTREWAGGTTDYTKGPFHMYVKSARVTDYNTGKEYSYGDHSGSWQSIKIAAGNSTAVETINAKPPKTIAEKWNELSPVAHIAIYSSAGALGAIIVAVGIYYCIKQRRRGREENRLYEQRLAAERLELDQFKKAGIDPDSLTHEGTDYNARDMAKNGNASANAYSVPQTPDSVADEKERAWGEAAVGGAAGVTAASAMRSPMPLLHNGAQSPVNDRGFNNSTPRSANYNSRSMYNNNGSRSPHESRMHSPAPPVSPLHSPIPGLPSPTSPTFGPSSTATRSFSAPNAQMRASPGPASNIGYNGIVRTQSPAFAAPTPQRSYTANAGWRGANTGPDYSGSSGYNNYTNNTDSSYGNSRNGPPYGGRDQYNQGAPGHQGGGFNNNYWG
ncbi:hypothetical protein SPBR_04164 [Sporothrix brasiliensis 5110]|uniref:chitinase n=1 Tax=Sporothrix brasiliensis 5110 TaxID=1398154 RepID=A0A0C2JA36_9PEZI|nr:uncharacterized protein SPBR_04164 [Sporothrix brasiliensis 5110]KIH93792.1 hypothetical protein SPBR_04164 [Sporothrix brasiliensis 5110]